jgi:hypothetical protein
VKERETAGQSSLVCLSVCPPPSSLPFFLCSTYSFRFVLLLASRGIPLFNYYNCGLPCVHGLGPSPKNFKFRTFIPPFAASQNVRSPVAYAPTVNTSTSSPPSLLPKYPPNMVEITPPRGLRFSKKKSVPPQAAYQATAYLGQTLPDHTT